MSVTPLSGSAGDRPQWIDRSEWPLVVADGGGERVDASSAHQFLDELDALLDAGHPFGLVLDLGRFDRSASQLVTEWLGERFERCASTVVAMSTVVTPATIAASRDYIDTHPESYPCACDVGASVSECAEWVRARLIERGQ